jgi:hypothetical protein
LAALGQRKAESAGVGDKVKIIQGDIFKEDFSKATVVTLYLLPELNYQLRDTLLKMKPGTRVVSHAFDMADWQPDGIIDAPARAYFWVVPVAVSGEWVLANFNLNNSATLSLNQKFQYVGGSLTFAGRTQPILNVQLKGDKLQFSYVDRNNTLTTSSLSFDGSKVRGEENSGFISRAFSDYRQ